MKTRIPIIYDFVDSFRKAAALAGVELEIVAEHRDGLTFEVTYDEPFELYLLGVEYGEARLHKIIDAVL